MKVYGYGVVFDRAVRLDAVREGQRPNDGLWEFARLPAFVGSVRCTSEVELQIQHHGEVVATRSAGSLRLGLDAHGLRFEAWIGRPEVADRVARLLVQGIDACSIGLDLSSTTFGMADIDGLPTQEILRAGLAHVALVEKHAAAYGTAVWAAGASLVRAPLHVRRAAAQWDRGAEQAARLAALFERVAKGAAARKKAEDASAHGYPLESFAELRARIVAMAAQVPGDTALLRFL